MIKKDKRKKKHFVIKSNELNKITFYRTPVELKIFSKLILEIQKDPSKEFYKVPIKELIEDINFDKEGYSKLKTIAKKMFGTLELPVKKGFHLTVLFYNIKTEEDGFLDFEVNQRIKPLLLELSNNFTGYHFENIARLKSQYSIRLYELLKQFERGGFWKKTVTEIKDILEIDPKQYIRYNDFKKDIILKAQQELEEKTDLKFTFEEHKTGKKIEMITFFISKNMKNIDPNIIDIEAIEPPKNNPLDDEKLLIFREKEAYKILINDLKITEKNIIEYLKIYPLDRIERNTFYTLEKLQNGEIKKSASGYLNEAIKNDRANQINIDISSKEYKEKEQKAREEKERLEKQKRLQLEELENEYNNAKKDFLNNFIDSQNPILDTLLTEFRQALINKEIVISLVKLKQRDLSNNESLLQIIKAEHFAMVKFRVFLAQKVLPKELENFENYIKNKL